MLIRFAALALMAATAIGIVQIGAASTASACSQHEKYDGS